MNKVIWKFQLAHPDVNRFSIPVGAKILSCHSQYSTICFWALVEPEKELESRAFRAYPTGCNLPNNPGDFIGTVHITSNIGQKLVFHVFEVSL